MGDHTDHTQPHDLGTTEATPTLHHGVCNICLIDFYLYSTLFLSYTVPIYLAPLLSQIYAKSNVSLTIRYLTSSYPVLPVCISFI